MAVPKKRKRPTKAKRKPVKRGKNGGARPGAGKKPIELNARDLPFLQELCTAGAPHIEIAAFLRISPRTLERMLHDEATLYEIASPEDKRKIERLSLAAIMERGYAHMRIGIRREQIKLLKGGSNTMAVWLGKQYLGQTDRMRVEDKAAEPEKAAVVAISVEELLSRRDDLLIAEDGDQ